MYAERAGSRWRGSLGRASRRGQIARGRHEGRFHSFPSGNADARQPGAGSAAIVASSALVSLWFHLMVLGMACATTGSIPTSRVVHTIQALQELLMYTSVVSWRMMLVLG